MAPTIKINDNLITPYDIPSVCWGRTEIEGKSHVICCFSAEEINQFRLPNGKFPVGEQFNGPASRIIILMAIPANKVSKKEEKNAAPR